MAIELIISGSLEMTIFDARGYEVDEETALSIMDNLQQGEYVIGINSREIKDINNLEDALYTFELDATEQTEYDFDEF